MGIFSIFNSGLDGVGIIIYLLAWMLAITVAICAHEYSHAVVAVKM